MRKVFQPARLVTASPRLTLALIAALTLFAAIGATRPRFNDDYRAIFQADSPEFLLLEQTARNFGSDDTNVFVLPRGAEVIEPGGLRRLRAIHDRSQQIEGVASVYSILSLPALAKLEVLGGDGATAIREQRPALLRHPLLKDKLISADGRATILVAGLEPDDLDIARIRATLDRIREVAGEDLAGSPMRLSLSGIPALRAEIVEAIMRDQIRFNAAGFCLVGSLALLIFRRAAGAAAVVLAGAPAVLGVVWTMGSLGLIGAEINVLNNVVPQLALVLGFSDSIHFTFHARKAIASGMPKREAALAFLRAIGPACLLTTLTTALGFGSLAWTRSPIIQSFGLTCAWGAAMSFLAVVMLTPLLILSPLGDRLGSPAKSRTPGWTDRWSDVVCRHSRWVALVGCLLLAAFLTAALRWEPNFRYTENLPSVSETSGAIALRDRLFGGSATVHALVEWPPAENALSARVVETLEAAERIFESSQAVRGTTSVLDLLRALPGEDSDLGSAVSYLSGFPAALERRFLHKDLRQALVTGVLPDLGAAELAPLFADLKDKLAGLEREHPGCRIRLTGLPLVSAESSLSNDL